MRQATKKFSDWEFQTWSHFFQILENQFPDFYGSGAKFQVSFPVMFACKSLSQNSYFVQFNEYPKPNSCTGKEYHEKVETKLSEYVKMILGVKEDDNKSFEKKVLLKSSNFLEVLLQP